MGSIQQEIAVLKSAYGVSLLSMFAAVPWWLWLLQLITIGLTQMLYFVLMTGVAGGTTLSISEVALGNALQAVTYSTVFAVCSIPGDEKHSATLPLLMNTPTKLHSVIIGKSLFHIAAGMMTVVVSLAFAALVFGVSFAQVDVLSLTMVVLVTTYAMTGFGLMLSSIGIYMRSSILLASFFLYIGLIFCGVNFPVSHLPSFLQPISAVLPMTYGVHSLRMAVEGAAVFEIAQDLVLMLVIGSIMLLIGFLMLRLFERLARIKGSYEMF